MILAFDTSNYTTSIAIVDGETIIVDERKLIDVKLGSRGIRQSDGFFQHMQALGEWVDRELPNYAAQLAAVAVSTRPRPVADSYMPVFRAGQIIGQTIANSLNIPLYSCSHQEGHLYSALRGQTIATDFLFLHLSGGTTEIHAVSWRDSAYRFSPIAATADISLGQLVDRIGVKAGLHFPCGAEMDRLSGDSGALQAPRFHFKSAFNLSGYENYFTNCLASHQPERVFGHLFEVLSDIVIDIVDQALSQTGLTTVLLAGGVAENSTVRRRLTNWSARRRVTIAFAAPRYASDNAVGVARFAQIKSNLVNSQVAF